MSLCKALPLKLDYLILCVSTGFEEGPSLRGHYVSAPTLLTWITTVAQGILRGHPVTLAVPLT